MVELEPTLEERVAVFVAVNMDDPKMQVAADLVMDLWTETGKLNAAFYVIDATGLKPVEAKRRTGCLT